jgi:hypothetical protein
LKTGMLLLLVTLAGCVMSAAMAAGPFVLTNCQSGECVWSSLGDPISIAKRANGELIGVASRFCVEKKGKYPPNYRCQSSVIMTSDTAAFCSRSSPSIAYKDAKGRWERTRLSISENGQFGYNRQAISDYLRICHGFVRDTRAGPSLDMIGAKYGYKDRYVSLGDKEHDALGEMLDLIE